MDNIFISFSGAAREEYALKFLNFFNRFGLHGWYDQHELLLGDVLKENIDKNGIQKVDYCVLIINQSFLSRHWPCEEAIRLYNRFEEKRDFVIFPILLDITKEDLKNSRLNFLLSIKYQFLRTGETIDQIAYQILNRIFFDIASHSKFQTLNDALGYFKRLTLTNSVDFFNALSALSNFDETDYRDKVIFLICLIRLLNGNPYEKAVREISYYIYDNRDISFDMYKIIESIFLITASTFAA